MTFKKFLFFYNYKIKKKILNYNFFKKIITFAINLIKKIMKLKQNIIIAIDGHASCGKSTLAKDIAKWLQYKYIDTGAMYRAVTLFALENNLITTEDIDLVNLNNYLNQINITFVYNKILEKSETYLNNKNVETEIRGMHVSNFVSRISTVSFVREKLVELQQKMGVDKTIVMDGRDIGTVVFPDAELKFFVTATAEVRAERRYKELLSKNQTANYYEIYKNVVERDKIDSGREISPLKQAQDAILLDNSNINIEEQFELVKKIILEKFDN